MPKSAERSYVYEKSKTIKISKNVEMNIYIPYSGQMMHVDQKLVKSNLVEMANHNKDGNGAIGLIEHRKTCM